MTHKGPSTPLSTGENGGGKFNAFHIGRDGGRKSTDYSSYCFLNFPDDNQHPILISIFEVFLVILTMANLIVSSYLFTIHFRASH